MKTIHVGLFGLGTVGAGVVKSLITNEEHIASRTGFRVQVKHALVQSFVKERSVSVPAEFLTMDAQTILVDPDISIVVEVMGGVEPARTYICAALLARKHVVTANKELLAKHGPELMALAAHMGVRLLFEASVGGGIPIVRTLQAYLTANRVSSIRGILNGTCNYMLTQMQVKQVTFADALTDAQRLGYAEADPQSDVEGYDAAYKLLILSNMVFPVQSTLNDIKRTGIVDITPDDIDFASRVDCVVKLIAQASYVDGSVHLDVSPRLIDRLDPLATVRDVFNAVTVSADVVGDLTFIGRGAGEMPTASAIIEDIVEVLRSPRTSVQPLEQHKAVGQDEQVEFGKRKDYYVRIDLADPISNDRINEEMRVSFRESEKVIQIGHSKHQLSHGFLIATEDEERILLFVRKLKAIKCVVFPYEGDKLSILPAQAMVL
ncbi:MAG: homoserine dehydrogenase [Acidibacillus sp.]|nr:homoserine dehydrogenase [Acidibacillus sp.]